MLHKRQREFYSFLLFAFSMAAAQSHVTATNTIASSGEEIGSKMEDKWTGNMQ